MIRVLPLFLAGCGLFDAPGDPWIEAHRAGADLWPENSRTAVKGSLEAGFDAIEFDLVLTSDGVPVVHHDPWLSPDQCTHADGSPLDEEVPIGDVDLATLLGDYLCGGEASEEHPDVDPVAEPLLTFEELLALAVDHPDTLLHVDVKYEPGITASAQDFADAILPVWFDADLPNDWYTSANTREMIAALEADARDVPTVLIWPAFPPGSSTTAIALTEELKQQVGVDSLLNEVRAAGADGVAIPWQIADRRQIAATRAAGYTTHLWTVDGEKRLKHYARWPLDSLITDDPREAP